jgi:hypothetical protein
MVGAGRGSLPFSCGSIELDRQLRLRVLVIEDASTAGDVWLTRLYLARQNPSRAYEPAFCARMIVFLVLFVLAQDVDSDVAAAYARGWAAAEAAYAAGGSPESLVPVNEAIAELERLTPRTVTAEIARNVLLASVAAAQNERDQMAIFLAHAKQIESLQLTARQPGAPDLTAHEAAGDLWLRVHRYEDARQAYLDAFKTIGPTPRTLLGLARADARLKDGPGACPDTRPTCP